MTRLGLSSGSLPAATAEQVLTTVEDLGLGVVDLRLGKGHGWEAAGLEPFVAAGIAVAFVGVGVTLGEGDPVLGQVTEHLGALLGRRRGIPVKVFASARLDSEGPCWELAALQLAALARTADATVLVETHHGYAGLPALQRLCTEHGCRTLLDIGGFYRLTGGFTDPVGLVAGHGRAAQVKGFAPGSPEDHRNLDHLPPAAWELLAQVPPRSPVTIESRAGDLAMDVRLLRQRLPEQTERP